MVEMFFSYLLIFYDFPIRDCKFNPFAVKYKIFSCLKLKLDEYVWICRSRQRIQGSGWRDAWFLMITILGEGKGKVLNLTHLSVIVWRKCVFSIMCFKINHYAMWLLVKGTSALVKGTRFLGDSRQRSKRTNMRVRRMVGLYVSLQRRTMRRR